MASYLVQNLKSLPLSIIRSGPCLPATTFLTTLPFLTPHQSHWPPCISRPMHMLACCPGFSLSLHSSLSYHHLRETLPRYHIWSLFLPLPLHKTDHYLTYIFPTGHLPENRVSQQGQGLRFVHSLADTEHLVSTCK